MVSLVLEMFSWWWHWMMSGLIAYVVDRTVALLTWKMSSFSVRRRSNHRHSDTNSAALATVCCQGKQPASIVLLLNHAGEGRALSHVCLSVCALKGKRLELSTQNLVYILCSSRSAWIDPEVKRSKVKITRLLVTLCYAATAVCCCFWRGSVCRYDCLYVF